MIYITTLLLAYAFLTIYDEYFRKRNKFSDQELFQRYVFADMKKRSRGYFPKMEIKGYE